MSVKHMENICGIFYKTVVNLKFFFFLSSRHGEIVVYF